MHTVFVVAVVNVQGFHSVDYIIVLPIIFSVCIILVYLLIITVVKILCVNIAGKHGINTALLCLFNLLFIIITVGPCNNVAYIISDFSLKIGAIIQGCIFIKNGRS